MSQDPIMFYGWQTNLYVYCDNTPTNATDPTGLDESYSTTIGGYNVYFAVAEGSKWTIADVLEDMFGNSAVPGMWGQPSQRAGGSIVQSKDAITTIVCLSNGNTCNTIIHSFSNCSGAIRVYTELPPGTYEIRYAYSFIEITDRVCNGRPANNATASLKDYYTPANDVASLKSLWSKKTVKTTIVTVGASGRENPPKPVLVLQFDPSIALVGTRKDVYHTIVSSKV
jgi:hypothetical protein